MDFKRSLVDLVGRPPLTTAFSARASRRPLVVLYHGVTTNGRPTGSENYRGKHVPLAEFRRQVAYLAERFEIVPLAEVESLVLERRAPGKPICAVTFDDGYLNNFTNAYPALMEMGVPATFFVTSGFLDGHGPLWTDRLEYGINKRQNAEISVVWESGAKRYRIGTTEEKIAADSEIRERLKRLEDVARKVILDSIISGTGADLADSSDAGEDYLPMSWAQAAEMARGRMTIGAHTVGHPILSRITAAEQASEISVGRDRVVAEVGECAHFAYPNGQMGDWNAETVETAKASGFRCAWTTEARRVRPATDDPFALPRLAMDSAWKGRRFEALVSDALPALRGMSRI